MDKAHLKKLLELVKSDTISIDEGIEQLAELPFTDLGYAKIDNHRTLRVGYPEVIYCAGKTIEQVVGIVKNMSLGNNNILGTRASKEMYDEVLKICPDAKYNELAKTITVERQKIEKTESYIAIVTAGTSDIPIAEEAAITAEIFGNNVKRIYDVGVAGIHRLFNRVDVIRGAKVVIVIAVPTSIGYGANFNGLSALLTMLNSCASGVSVVNIDNGFGAGYNASMINKL